MPDTMLDTMLDLLPPGSKLLSDEIELQNSGFFGRPMTFPIAIPA